MGLLIALASVVAYIIIGWLMLLASILVFSEEWTDELCDCRGQFRSGACRASHYVLANIIYSFVCS